MTTELDELVRDAIGTFRDAAPSQRALMPALHSGTRRSETNRQRSTILVLVASILVLGAMAVVASRPPQHPTVGVATRGSASGLNPTVPSSALHSTVPEPVTGVSAVPDRTWSWRSAGNLVAAGALTVNSIAAGPNGYLATGFTNSTSDNVHRGIWFSPDGRQWEPEPLDQFDGLGVSGVQATSTSFYVFGVPSPVSPDSPPPPSHLFQSEDGKTWTDIGDAPARGIALVGNLFLSITGSSLVASADATSWSPVIVDGVKLQADSTIYDTAVAGGRMYATVSTPTPTSVGVHVITSSDGVHWTALPDPPAGGRLVATSDGVLLVSNVAAFACLTNGSEAPTTATASGTELCVRALTIYRYAIGDGRWAQVTFNGLPPVAFVGPTIATPDGRLVIPVFVSDGSLEIYESIDGATTWSRINRTPFVFSQLPVGLTPSVQATANGDQILITGSVSPFNPTLVALVGQHD
jgi:hypothetical protein